MKFGQARVKHLSALLLIPNAGLTIAVELITFLAATVAQGPDPAFNARQVASVSVRVTATIVRVERIKLENFREKRAPTGEVRRLVEFE